MAFKIGQKVVYVRNTPRPYCWAHLPPSSLKIGGVYTIREFEPAWIRFTGYPGVRVIEEIMSPVMWRGVLIESSFQHFRFRPAVECKTDISIFTRILDDASKRRELQKVS